MKTNLKRYFQDKDFLNKAYNFHIYKNNIKQITFDKNLINAHLMKARHNLDFFDFTIKKNNFNDWAIIELYYAIYHVCLALVANKGFASKNYTATLIFIIKYYSDITLEDISQINDLNITKSDAEFYLDIKNERHNANYSTHVFFSKKEILELKSKTIDFIHKAEEILQK